MLTEYPEGLMVTNKLVENRSEAAAR